MPKRPVFRPHSEDVPFLRRLAWAIAILALLIVVWRAAHLLLLAFGSVLVAVVFRTVARLLRRAGLPGERLSLGVATVLVLAVAGAFGWLLGRLLHEQLAAMVTTLPAAVADVESRMEASPVGAAIVEAVRTALGGSTFADVLGGLALGAGEIALNFVIVIVGAVFVAADPQVYARGIVQLTPAHAREAMRSALSRIYGALRLWLRAQLVCMTTMGLLVAAGLWLVGIEGWAALGLLAGLSEFIPYVGPTVAMLPALALAATEGTDTLLLTLLAYFVIRMIQTNLITPLVTRQVVSIPPALTLFVILGMGAVFGVYGLFFSAALLVVGFVAVRELYLRDTLGEEVDPIPPETAD